MPDLDPLIDVLRRDVPGLVAVYLFGSQAMGDAMRDSDLDLAVLAEHPLGAVKRFDVQERLAVVARRDVDLVDLRRASTVMHVQVVSTGRVILDGDSGARVRFETVAYSAYAMLNEERAGILEDIAARGTIYG